MAKEPVRLFPDQRERFVRPISDAFAGGACSVLGVLPTGGGKTVCFSYITQAAIRAEKRVGIVAPRIEIIDQISKTLDRFDVPHGFIVPGRWTDPLARVQVCSGATLGKRAERLQSNPFDILILDEAHHAAAGSLAHQIAGIHLRAGKRVLGVTATPRRLSGEPLDIFEKMIIGPTMRELIALGRLSAYKAYAPVTADMSGIKRRGGDFARGEAAERMDTPTITGDAVREYKRRMPGKRALVFCVSVAHAEHVAAQFTANGIPARAIDGNTDKKYGRGTRRAFLDDFESGKFPVLTSADLVSEGFDVPAVEGCFLLRPTESVALYLQQVGRAMRALEGKSHAIICDHVGNIARHGLPDDEREWTLGGAKKIVGGLSVRDAILPTRVCASCFGVFRAGPAKCPYCETVIEIEGRKIKEVDGDLEEVDLNEMRAAMDRRDSVQRARSVDDLCKVAVAQGYKAGWVINMLKARKAKPVAIAVVLSTMAKHRRVA